MPLAFFKNRGNNMAINKVMRRVLKAFSFDKVEVEAFRNMTKLKALDPLRIFYKTVDYQVFNEAHEVPLRIFLPHEDAMEEQKKPPVMFFIHGGGWAVGTLDSYERICSRLAADTGHLVVSVEYRLAPEYKFPIGLEDCYCAAKALFEGKIVPWADETNITLIGDSAGGNLTAALSLLARDRKEFMPQKQILIYPVVNSDYSDNSLFPSVRENGSDYILTSGKLRDYIDLYAKDENDKKNPYFAPILSKDLSGQPDTLILTAEFDPLRDEGEAYGYRLKKAGNKAKVCMIKNALHGYFELGLKHYHVEESFELIKQFLEGDFNV